MRAKGPVAGLFVTAAKEWAGRPGEGSTAFCAKYWYSTTWTWVS
jgi:hypothetical protein